MTELFSRDKSVISRHIKNALFEELNGEIAESNPKEKYAHFICNMCMKVKKRKYKLYLLQNRYKKGFFCHNKNMYNFCFFIHIFKIYKKM